MIDQPEPPSTLPPLNQDWVAVRDAQDNYFPMTEFDAVMAGHRPTNEFCNLGVEIANGQAKLYTKTLTRFRVWTYGTRPEIS